jgi:hypothetical protein
VSVCLWDDASGVEQCGHFFLLMATRFPQSLLGQSLVVVFFLLKSSLLSAIR